MPLVPAKCPSCGGNVVVDNEKEAWVCDFCKTPFVVEKAINNFNTINNITNNIEADIVNVYKSMDKDFEIQAGVLKKYVGEAVDVIIPDNVVKIDSNAFKNCECIRSIKFGGGIKSIGNINEEFFLGDRLINYELTSNDMMFLDCKMLESIELPEGILYIGDGVFCECYSLKKINFPPSIKKIGKKAFMRTSLEKVEYKGLSVTIDKKAFCACKNLNTVKIGTTGSNKSSINIQEAAFFDCGSLKRVEISSDKVNVGAYAFARCEKLQSLKIPNAEEIGDNFVVGCKSLKEIKLPSKVLNLNEHVITGLNSSVVNWICASGAKTTKVGNNGILVIKDGTTDIRYDGSLYDVKEIVVPGSVRHIKARAFDQFKNLRKITLLNGITHIDTGAFMGCNKLKEISIPTTVISIGDCFREIGGWGDMKGENTTLEEIDISEKLLRKNIVHFFNGIINSPYMKNLNSNGKFCPRCGNRYGLFTQSCTYCGHKRGTKIETGAVVDKNFRL